MCIQQVCIVSISTALSRENAALATAGLLGTVSHLNLWDSLTAKTAPWQPLCV